MFGKRILRDWIELEKNGRIRGIPLIDEQANEKPASGGGRGGGGVGREELHAWLCGNFPEWMWDKAITS